MAPWKRYQPWIRVLLFLVGGYFLYGTRLLLFEKRSLHITRHTFISHTSPLANSSSPKVILYWKKLYFAFTGVDFSQCEFPNCVSTLDRNQYASSAAVVFSGRQLKNKGIQKLKSSLPRPRSSSQYWIYFNVESQINTANGPRLKALNGLFNLTMTFLESSDIVIPFATVRKRDSGNAVPLTLDVAGKYKNRSHLVAWLVSHCETTGKREVYFEELEMYVQSDGFGKCYSIEKCHENKCMEFISQQYKFYFAAENSMCKDYITEKVYHNAFVYDIVPIVYGVANYSHYLPPKSYIDVRDFDSPKSLANYLELLDRNDNLYNEYFAWKKNYEIIYGNQLNNGHCGLCKLLHRKDKPVKSVTDLDMFWTVRDCVPAERHLQSLGVDYYDDEENKKHFII